MHLIQVWTRFVVHIHTRSIQINQSHCALPSIKIELNLKSVIQLSKLNQHFPEEPWCTICTSNSLTQRQPVHQADILQDQTIRQGTACHQKSEPFESNSPMRQETWSHKSGKQLKQRSHLGLRCIELSELRRDLQIFRPPWLMTGDWGAVPQALTSVIKAATSAKCNWADCLGSSKHYVIGLIKVIKRGRRGGGSRNIGSLGISPEQMFFT